ncbi:hypothetical protein B484DRAFT_395445 [Ochromonadaceae sp. CCMP2298]|nr:hypothetical protein B484DRAFT_395445 [Ochromonadaceae sp. CCMP2298]
MRHKTEIFEHMEAYAYTTDCVPSSMGNHTRGNDLDVDLDMVQGYQTDEYGFSDSIESAAGPTLSKHHCPRGCTTRLLGA